jgi:CBS domain-containing protein
MPETVQQVMTRDPVCFGANTPFCEAAEAMREQDIGDVIVTKDGAVCGIVTDRDIVVRGIAAGLDPMTTPLGEICSRTLVTIAPDDPVERAIDLMRQKAIRRLPVCDGDEIVGIVTLGDLAVDREPQTVLANITEAPAQD